MASDQGLNLLGKEREGDGCEVGGLGETGRDTVILLSHIWSCFEISR